jgi:PhzF family phenazine biosynthesis protein
MSAIPPLYQDQPMRSPLHYTAFTDTPGGGNPAGVVLDAREYTAEDMQRVAAELGYSESAFLLPRDDGGYDIRYYSPEAEVAFCGHATIATAVALAESEGVGRRVFQTRQGGVPVDTCEQHGAVTATLTSVAPYVEEAPPELLAGVLDSLRWDPGELDPRLPVRVAYAGVRHLVLAARTRERLADLDYGFDALKALMLAHDLTTISLVYRDDTDTFAARNPFPVGGVVEDPATGAAAAAFGAYLRELGVVEPPATITIHQGDDMGRPSVLMVDIGTEPEIRVTGRAVAFTPS